MSLHISMCEISDLSLPRLHTHTSCPNSFCLFVLGVALKPWCRATHRFSFNSQSHIPLRHSCLTVFPSFAPFLLSVAFPTLTLPSHTPIQYIQIHTHTHTLTNENWLHWSWQSTAAALLITHRHHSL